MKGVTVYLCSQNIPAFGTFYFTMSTLVTNIYFIIYFIQNQTFHHEVLNWTLSANKPTCSVTVLLQQVRRSMLCKHFLYLLIRLRTDWVIYRWHLFLARRDQRICTVSWRTEGSCVVPSRSMMILCNKQIHLTVISSLLNSVCIALFNNRHFALRIPKAHWTHLLTRDNLQLETCSSHDKSFLAKGLIRYVYRG